MKQGANVKKVCNKKKITKYTKTDCESELARLVYKDKNGVVRADSSQYKKDVEERLASLR